MNVATLLTAATVLVLGYRWGRTHAAWKDVRDAKRAVLTTRRHAWGHTVRLVLGAGALFLTVAAAAYESH